MTRSVPFSSLSPDLQAWARQSPRRDGRPDAPSVASLRTKLAIKAAKERARRFRLLCRDSGLPMPTTEHRFHDVRGWRFDFAWTEEKLALECDGGVYVRGRHARGVGIQKAHEKLNAATLAGWRVLFCVPRQLCTSATVALVRAALTQEEGT